MKKRSDFYKSGLAREKIIERVSTLTFIELGDGAYDIIGNVDFSELDLNSLLEVMDVLKELIPSEIPVRIRKVHGSFDCSNNNLKDLKGAPEEVEGAFDCNYNQLETLEGAPRYVGVYFDCSHNKIISLKGAPKYVGKDFICYGNPTKITEEERRKLVNVRGEIIM